MRYVQPIAVKTIVIQTIVIHGEITHQEVDNAGVMERLLESGKQKIAGNTVWLASNGGDIDAGMNLGRLLRKLGIFTLIGKNDQYVQADALERSRS